MYRLWIRLDTLFFSGNDDRLDEQGWNERDRRKERILQLIRMCERRRQQWLRRLCVWALKRLHEEEKGEKLRWCLFQRMILVERAYLDAVVHFSVTSSGKEGVLEMEIGSCIVKVPKYLSAHHPLLQMLLFAHKSLDGAFACLKSMAPKSIFDMSGCSASPIVYGAGWVSAKPKSESPNAGTEPKFSHQQQGVLTGGTDPATEVQVSMGQEVSCISTMNMEKIPDSVDAATSLHSPGDVGSNSPRSNGARRITSEITLDPMVQQLTKDESQHYRGLDSSAKDDDQRGATIFMMNGVQGTNFGLAIIDSGAAVHVTGNISLFSQLGAEPPGTKLYAANGDEMQSYGSGSICLPSLELKDVLYVPCVNKTIVSVSKLNELGYSVNFNRAGCSVRDERTWTRKLVGKARHSNGQYELDYLNIPLSRAPVSEGPLISLWRAACSSWSSLTKSLIQRNNILASQRPSV